MIHPIVFREEYIKIFGQMHYFINQFIFNLFMYIAVD